MSAAPAPKPWPTVPGSESLNEDLHEAIRRRAEEIYALSGCIPGRDEQNWLQAEREIQAESEAQKAGLPKKEESQTSREPPDEADVLVDAPLSPRAAVVVKVNGVQYIGEYSPDSAGGYTPGEFKSGEPVPVRFAGDKMFVKRPNGRELETRIVRKSHAG